MRVTITKSSRCAVILLFIYILHLWLLHYKVTHSSIFFTVSLSLHQFRIPNATTEGLREGGVNETSSSESVHVSSIRGSKTKSKCDPEIPRLWHSPQSKLAQWTKDYFDWHYDTRCEEQKNISMGISVNASRYLVVQCLKHQTCGGAADRLQPLPAYVLEAALSKRIILILWKKPFRLEEFFIPPVGGINWTVPDWLKPQIPRHNRIKYMRLDALEEMHRDTRTVVVGKIQVYAQSLSIYFNRERSKLPSDPNPEFRIIFRDMFRAFFALSHPVEKIVTRTMSEHGLRPNDFVTAHIRARYPTGKLKGILGNVTFDKSGGLPFDEVKEVKDYIVPVAENAINCAASILPDKPIYIASDSDQVVKYLMEESDFVKKRTKEGKRIVLTSIPHTSEPLHMETQYHEKHSPEDFYSTFVDLWILGQAQCTAYGMGGFGRFGMNMSYNASCSVTHRKSYDFISNVEDTSIIQKCPSVFGEDTLTRKKRRFAHLKLKNKH